MIRLKHFKKEEFDCSETGENQMSESFLYRLDELRTRCGFPFVVLSGYRSPKHSLERKKDSPGAHAVGVAADIRCSGPQMRKLVFEAMRMGFKGVGVNNGSVHIDDLDRGPIMTMWGYGGP